MSRTGHRALVAVSLSILLGLTTACASLTNEVRGTIIGAAGGAAVGAVVGDYVGDAAKGAIIGAAVGGVAGAIIGSQMDEMAGRLADDLDNATVSRVGEGIVVTFDSGLLFDFDSSTLRGTSEENLTELAESLENYPRTNALIIGHTDSIGSEEYNQALSERRANSAEEFIEAQGIAGDRVATRGLGEEDPVADNGTEEGRQLNRRVEVVIYASEEWREQVANQQQ